MSEADNTQPVEVEDIDVNDIALAAMQGMLAAGMDPQTAAGNAWMVAVPVFFDARLQYADMAAKMNAQIAQQSGQG